jgi:hypothetical protein
MSCIAADLTSTDWTISCWTSSGISGVADGSDAVRAVMLLYGVGIPYLPDTILGWKNGDK